MTARIDLRRQMLDACDAYAAATGKTDGALSKLIFRSGNRLARYRAGGRVTVSSWEICLTWLADHWPMGVEWPAGVLHPAELLHVARTRVKIVPGAAFVRKEGMRRAGAA